MSEIEQLLTPEEIEMMVMFSDDEKTLRANNGGDLLDLREILEEGG